MSRRFTLLLTIAAAIFLGCYVEYAFFTVLRPAKAVFIQLALLGVLSALGTVLARNLVHAALYLVAFFFIVACLFVLLEAEFLAAMQVLVYIGAIAVLLMFAIMLTRNVQGDDTTTTPWPRKILPALVALGLLFVLTAGVLSQRVGPQDSAAIPGEGRTWRDAVYRARTIDPGDVELNARGIVINDMPRSIGNELMTRWALTFEVAGLLLTAALVGAVALARTETFDENEGKARVARTIATAPTGNGDAGKTLKPAELSHTH